MRKFIKVQNVSLQIKNNIILKDISISLAKNQFVALTGANGSGKTTLGKIIMNILQPSSGEVLIDDTNINQMILAEVGSKIGYLFQNPNRQIFAPTVIEELSFALRYKGISESKISNSVNEMLEVFHLTHIKNAQAYFLSQGEKQRVALATIMLNNPQYLILDEPTTGLDGLRKRELSKLFYRIRDMNIGVLMISHDFDFVNNHADRIIELSDGCVINDKQI